jgi:hypothetical protein
VEEGFRLIVVWREDLVFQRPGRRDAARVADFIEIAFAQTEEGGAVDLGVAANIIVESWTEGLAASVGPGLGSLIFAIDEDR